MKTDAQKKAQEKYRKSDKYNWTTIASGMPKSDAERIRAAASKLEMTPSKFMLSSALYCIDNGIDPKKDE